MIQVLDDWIWLDELQRRFAPNRRPMAHAGWFTRANIKRRRKDRAAVICIEIGRFEMIAASLGDAVREVLQEVKRRVNDALAEAVTWPAYVEVGDAGTRRLSVLLAGVGGEVDAREIARRLQERIVEPIFVSGRVVYLKARVGIAVSEQDAATDEGLFCKAEKALLRAMEKPERHGRAIKIKVM